RMQDGHSPPRETAPATTSRIKSLSHRAQYVFDSIRTYSYWRYAVFSPTALSRVLTFVGALYLFIEMLDFFGIYRKDQYAGYAFLLVLGVAFLTAIVTRAPITRTVYKIPGKDLLIEVRIDDLFSVPGQTVVSMNTTFETNTSGGLISLNSLQAQFSTKYFPNK